MSISDMKIYQDAINKWGQESQLNMLVEECAELISAVNRLRRGNTDSVPVLEELADVDIMIEQMKMIFDRNTIESIKCSKLSRLRERINED